MITLGLNHDSRNTDFIIGGIVFYNHLQRLVFLACTREFEFEMYVCTNTCELDRGYGR